MDTILTSKTGEIPELDAKFMIIDLEPELEQPLAIVHASTLPEAGTLLWKAGPNSSTLTQVEFITSGGTLSRPYPVVCLCGLCNFLASQFDPDRFAKALKIIDRTCQDHGIKWLIVHRRPRCELDLATVLIEGLQAAGLELIREQVEKPGPDFSLAEIMQCRITQRYK